MTSRDANEHGQDPEQIREALRERVRRGDNSGYEALYAGAKSDPSNVPWAHLKPNVNVTRWLDANMPGASGQTALVIGCGLGDDAEELSRRGFDVTAFDVAPTAIAWCRQRFPSSRVKHHQADLLAPPAEWGNAFEFVLEAYTIQAMGLELRGQALRSVASFVAPGGTLLVVCRARDEADPPGELPFPLLRRELDLLQSLDLRERSFEDYLDDERPPVRRFRASYVKPTVSA